MGARVYGVGARVYGSIVILVSALVLLVLTLGFRTLDSGLTNQDLLIGGSYIVCPEMDFSFNHQLLTSYEFNSDL